jgi:hypothetical protein
MPDIEKVPQRFGDQYIQQLGTKLFNLPLLIDQNQRHFLSQRNGAGHGAALPL